MKRILSLILVVALCFGLCVPAMAAKTETVDITYRAIKIVLNGTEITPCDAAGKTVEPFILNSLGSTYLPLRAIGQALGLDVAWDGATNTVSLTSGGSVKTGAEPAGTTKGGKQVEITYRDIKVFLDGTQLVLKNALGQTVEPFILNSNSSVYLPLRVIGEAFGLDVKWEPTLNTVYLDEPAPPAPDAVPLAIKTQPVSKTLEFGSEDYLFVKAEGGKAPYSYQWQYSNKSMLGYKNVLASNPDLSGENGDKLTVSFTDQFAGMGYKFRCEVTDAEGNKVYSDPAAIDVSYKLEISKHPSEAEFKPGNPVYFEVEAINGTVPYTYKWQYATDGITFKDIGEAEAAAGLALNFTTAKISVFLEIEQLEDYFFRCVVTDADGKSITSDPARAFYKAPLTISTQPKSAECEVGDVLDFKVVAEGGMAPYTYQWMYGDASCPWVEAKESSIQSGVTTDTLTINVKSDIFTLGSKYYCVVTDADGKTVDSDVVYITEKLEPLAITFQPVNVKANVGDTVDFVLAANGGKAPYTYRWMYRDAFCEWENANNNSVHAGVTSDKLSVYLAPDYFSYGCEYYCIVTDDNGNTVESDAVRVINKKALSIVSEPVNTVVKAGKPVSFTVQVSGGNGPYTYQWQAYDFGLNRWMNITRNADGYNTPTLTLTANAESAAMEYRCSIVDRNGDAVISECVKFAVIR